jgi:hypothetical protein
MKMASKHMDGNNMSTGMGSVPLTKEQIRDRRNTVFCLQTRASERTEQYYGHVEGI